MTQEELDALMNSDVDEPELGDETENESSDADVSEDSVDDIVDDVLDSMPDEISEDEPYNETDPEKYRVSALQNWHHHRQLMIIKWFINLMVSPKRVKKKLLQFLI